MNFEQEYHKFNTHNDFQGSMGYIWLNNNDVIRNVITDWPRPMAFVWPLTISMTDKFNTGCQTVVSGLGHTQCYI